MAPQKGTARLSACCFYQSIFIYMKIDNIMHQMLFDADLARDTSKPIWNACRQITTVDKLIKQHDEELQLQD